MGYGGGLVVPDNGRKGCDQHQRVIDEMINVLPVQLDTLNAVFAQLSLDPPKI
jgi:hypothetical protein